MRQLNIHTLALERAAQAWCEPDTCMKDMDATLCAAFARILDAEMFKPNLGCATTRQLLEELSARSNLDYRTIDGDAIPLKCL